MGDSHVRGYAVRIKYMINDEFEVCGLVKPGSTDNNLTKPNSEVKNLSKSDNNILGWL
jgi:hypothetical protein